MPDVTPIYGFPFPCPDDMVSPTDFFDLASAIDAKLQTLANDEQATLFRPSFDLFSVSNTAAAGVTKVTTGGESSIVTPQNGIYMATAEVLPEAGDPVTLDAMRLRVRLAGTPVFGKTYNRVNDGAIGSPQFNCTGLFRANEFDLIDTDFLFTGSGNMDYRVQMSIKLICVAP